MAEPALVPGSPKPGGPLGNGTMWLVALLVIASGGATYFGWRAQQLSTALHQLTHQREGVEEAQTALNSRWQTVQTQYDELTKTHQALSQDRDNLIAQLASTKEVLERQREETAHQESAARQTAAERDLLASLLKKAAEEHRALSGQVGPLQDHIQELERAYDQALQERDVLKGDLAKALQKTQEKQLKQDLAAQRKERQELERQLRSTHRELGEIRGRETRVKKQLKSLQEDYAKVAADRNRLKRQNTMIPSDVNQLAREHQRLLKETADMHYNLGVLFSQQRQYARAAAEFNKVIELRPDDADTCYNLGVIYAEHLPDRERAIALFRRYLKINPRARDASWVKQYIASWQAYEAKERLE